jgi:hypothetical protein
LPLARAAQLNEFPPVRSPFAATVLLLLLSLARASAVILYDADATANIVAPSSGAPWDHVGRMDIGGAADATGVYLGNNFVLTANHVNIDATSTILLNGQTYSIDTSYTPLQIGGADIKLIKILGSTGLSALSLMTSSDTDSNQSCTIIGWGAGNGSAVTGGWLWSGSSSSRVERWGTNNTLSGYTTFSGLPYLTTQFNSTGGADEAAIAMGDSGCGLFIDVNGTWELAGVGSEVQTSGTSRYFPPDKNYFVPISQYESQIQTQTDIPEPSTLLLVVSGVAILAYRRPRFL